MSLEPRKEIETIADAVQACRDGQVYDDAIWLGQHGLMTVAIERDGLDTEIKQARWLVQHVLWIEQEAQNALVEDLGSVGTIESVLAGWRQSIETGEPPFIPMPTIN